MPLQKLILKHLLYYLKHILLVKKPWPVTEIGLIKHFPLTSYIKEVNIQNFDGKFSIIVLQT